MLDATSSGFPHAKLTKILRISTNTPLQILKRQLFNNAASVRSRHGGGAQGQLGIVLDANWYLAVSGNIAWVTPKHPGNSPNLTLATTADQRKQVTCQYDSDLLAFTLCNKRSNGLKQHMLLSVNSSFLCALEDPTFGFMTAVLLAMMQHLDSTYSTFTHEELEVNK
jgi:hypothetical protein